MSRKRMTLKTICLILGFVLLLSGLSACGKNEAGNENSIPSQSSTGPEDHQTPEKPEWEKKLDELYEAYYSDLRVRTDEWEQEMALCNDEEKRIMKYYFITTDMSTLCGIDFSLLHKYASHAAMLRETMPWTKELPEDTFLCYVASYRHLWEPVTDCRDFFYEQLKDIIDGKSLTDAVLLVNNWCGEQAGYISSDQKIASPLGMYNGGEGRCGEETCFVVNVLRSVGIPARGCGVDWTIELGDHEFVQVLVDGEWHFMGACEPDPVLDSDWFTDRLGSLFFTRSRFYSDIGLGQESLYQNGFYFINDIENFAEAKEHTIKVIDSNGKSAPGATIGLTLIVEDGMIFPLDDYVTDENGELKVMLGRGSVFAFTELDNDTRFTFISDDDTETVISFAEDPLLDTWGVYETSLSDAPTKRSGSFTDEQRKALFGTASTDETRANNHAGDFDEVRAAAFPGCEEILRKSGRNFDELMKFLEKDSDPMRAVLVSGISEKYSREVNSETLEDILKGAEAVRGTLNDEDFIKGLLYPAWEWSYFSPQRETVLKMFTDDELSAFRNDPEQLYKWLLDHVDSECVRPIARIGSLSSSLSSALKMGYCPENHIRQVFMELARAVGVPVSRDEETKICSYLSSEGWKAMDFLPDNDGGSTYEDIKYGTVRFFSVEPEELKDLQMQLISRYQYWPYSVEILDINYYLTLFFKEEGDDMEVEEEGSGVEWEIPVGDYYLSLLKKDDQYNGTVYLYHLKIEEGKTTVVKEIK